MNRTIVIVHPGGVGDLLLAVPAIRSLRARLPQHQLLLCSHDQGSEFLHDCGLVERWISMQPACTALFGGAVPHDPLLKDWLSRCDFAVAWTRDESGRLATALKQSGAMSIVVRSPFDSTLKALHQSDRFLEILTEPSTCCLPMTPLSMPVRLREQASVYLQTCGLLPSDRPMVLIHPGSGSRHKCVEPAVLEAVMQQLDRQDLIPLILEGPADEEPVKRLLSQMSITPTVVSGLSLSVLAGLLSRVELFIGHDSGITHLAALLGLPTVALFGPTSPERWAPRGSHVIVVHGEPCRCLSWDEVSRCGEKPCLRISSQAIVAACRAHELPA